MEFRLDCRRYSLPFRAPVRTARGAWPVREGLYVRVERPDGSAGFGEASPLPIPGAESPEDDEAFCRSLGGEVDGQVLGRVPGRLCSLRYALRCAIGGARAPRHGNLGVAALLPAGRSALADAPPKADAGFRVFKWKVGVGAADDEMALFDDLIGALPAGSRFRLDANGAWDPRTAKRWLDRCSERPVEFVEQPVAADSRGAEDQLRGLSGDYPVPIALDESIGGDRDIGGWIDAGWAGYFVIKPALLGDAPDTLARLAAAKARVVFSSSLETAIGAQAALREAFAWPGDTPALGFGVWPLFSDATFDGPTAVPFLRSEDVERINPEAAWNAAS
ncbi:MAG TPA: o-succinylbenzoate synthase [Opitutaceae bacterium]|nr:o-succinylbenzoate synthase [Opitutaceae bacterium]